MTERDDLVASAVKFLKDPKVQEAPLAKRIAFLESKGLTTTEIEAAMAQTTSAATSAATSAPLLPPKPHSMTVANSAGWTWKDYTLSAIAVGGASYAATQVIQKYFSHLLPSILPQIEKDTQRIDTQLEEAATTLQTITTQTTDMLTLVQSKATESATQIKAVEERLESIKESDTKRDGQLEALQREVDGLKNMIPKMVLNSKENHERLMGDIQNELKSLKSLMLNRRVTPFTSGGSAATTTSAASAGTTTSADEDAARAAEPPQWEVPSSESTDTILKSITSRTLSSKPSIPAWQLKESASQAVIEKSPNETVSETVSETQ